MKCTFCRAKVTPRREHEHNYSGSYTHLWEGEQYVVCWNCYFSPRYPEIVKNWEARKNYVRRSAVVDGKVYPLAEWERYLLSPVRNQY